MENEKVWNYIGKGDYIDGIPARDLFAADVARLDVGQLIAVEQSSLYRRVPRLRMEELEPEPGGAVEAQPGPGVEDKTPKGAKNAKEAKE